MCVIGILCTDVVCVCVYVHRERQHSQVKHLPGNQQV